MQLIQILRYKKLWFSFILSFVIHPIKSKKLANHILTHKSFAFDVEFSGETLPAATFLTLYTLRGTEDFFRVLNGLFVTRYYSNITKEEISAFLKTSATYIKFLKYIATIILIYIFSTFHINWNYIQNNHVAPSFIIILVLILGATFHPSANTCFTIYYGLIILHNSVFSIIFLINMFFFNLYIVPKSYILYLVTVNFLMLIVYPSAIYFLQKSTSYDLSGILLFPSLLGAFVLTALKIKFKIIFPLIIFILFIIFHLWCFFNYYENILFNKLSE